LGRQSSDDLGAPLANATARAKATLPVVDSDLIKSFLMAALGATWVGPSIVLVSSLASAQLKVDDKVLAVAIR